MEPFRPAALPESLQAAPPRSVGASPAIWPAFVKVAVVWMLFAALAAGYWLSADSSRRTWIWGGGLLGFFLLLLLCFAILHVTGVRTRRRLDRDGVAIAGEVTLTRFGSDGEGTRILFVHYRYGTPPTEGEEQVFDAEIARLGFRPEIGDTVFILHDPRRPAKHQTRGYARRPA